MSRKSSIASYYKRKPKGKPIPYEWSAKRAARDALRGAVWRGKIIKPDKCSKCGRTVMQKHKLHGHHHDYNKPLDVEWLCSDCHGLERRLSPEESHTSRDRIVSLAD